MATVEERVSLLTLDISIQGSGAWLHLGAFTSTHPKPPSIISISHHSLHPARSSNLREPFLTHLSNRTLTDPNTVRIVIPAPLCALVLRPETLSNPRHPLFLLEACALPPSPLPAASKPLAIFPYPQFIADPVLDTQYRIDTLVRSFALTVSSKTASFIQSHKKQGHRANPSPQSDLSVAYLYPFKATPSGQPRLACLVGLW